MKKRTVLLAICSLSAILLFLNAAPPPPQFGNDDLLDSYEQQPPIPLHYWVQKLRETREDGTNMIMKIEYMAQDDLPSDLNIYYADSSSITFSDDGNAPDVKAGDHIYSAYIRESISDFTSRITGMESNLIDRGSFLNFTGHAGELITEIPHFDLDGFNAFGEVEISAFMINGAYCDLALIKQKSLFITDLGVVEDQLRTYNIVSNGGLPNGPWTFGTLIKNVVNSNTPNTSKEFLKQWVNQWMEPQIINGQTVDARTNALELLILPWLIKANNWATNHYAGLTTTTLLTQWKTDWDATYTDEESLLKYAPFKLTAIVNRLDLKGNLSYKPNIKNAGETRFIFTLINPFSNDMGPAGYPPLHVDNAFPGIDFLDWKGMNVILEYANVQKTKCELKSFAQQWLNLSDQTLPLGYSQYNAALAAITNTVTPANAAPQKTNGSALARIRTNERIFFGTNKSLKSWAESKWELRQFELDPSTHLLVGVPVTNTPVTSANFNENIGDVEISTGGAIYSNITASGVGGANAENLIDWVYAPINIGRVTLGNHNLPANYSTSVPLLAATAKLEAEYVNSWDFFWNTTPTANYDKSNIPTYSGYPKYDKNLRRQISLNTCQGCHGGETKTMFTMVAPMGYGEKAEYWSSNVANYTKAGLIDLRSHNTNDGETTEPIVSAGYVKNYDALLGNNQYVLNVSAFLTGRSYRGAQGQGTFEDDKLNDPVDNAFDSQFDDDISLFYVNDPSNGNDPNGGTFPNKEMKWGYNDLQMRKQRLCEFLNTSCIPSITMEIVASTSLIPLPPKSH